jgi:hypothetical protein
MLDLERQGRLDAPSRLPELWQTHQLQSLGPTQRDGVPASCKPAPPTGIATRITIMRECSDTMTNKIGTVGGSPHGPYAATCPRQSRTGCRTDKTIKRGISRVLKILIDARPIRQAWIFGTVRSVRLGLRSCLARPGSARPSQSERVSAVVRLRCEAGRSAACTVPVVAHQRASGMEITNTVPARKKRSSFGSSLNRFADECPLSRVKRTWRLHCK